ncbi:HAD-IA family hydrolase [Streptacidiphilus cavernicola]|uniref:HAD-IA family hydrolase n=1 Tax=Streptacidiphilus cavernicola TaxID=3342716 RepID=A0ABV6VQ11_9ACTN
MAPEISPYGALILDFAGVLTEGIHESQVAWCRAEGLDDDAWRRTLNDHPQGRQLYTELEIGRMDQVQWNEATAPLLGVAPDNLMGRAWAEVRPARAMIELAKAAREAGLKVALLSNSFGLSPYNPYEHVEVWNLFDVRVVSELVGLAKPDPAIYRLTLDRLDLPAGECVFVDDHPKNLPPAAALGITTVLGDGSPEVVERLRTLLGVQTPVA